MFLLLVTVLIAPLGIPAIAQDEEQPSEQPAPEPVVVDPTIQQVWQMVDGSTADGSAPRAWVFGPEPIAASIEYYPQSPTQHRKLVYYDKGRLDLVNPELPPGSIWMVSGALLVSEMLSGNVQLGETEFVEREPADIPIVGDLTQEEGVTYASLAPLSSVWSPDEEEETDDGDEPADPNEPAEVAATMSAPEEQAEPTPTAPIQGVATNPQELTAGTPSESDISTPRFLSQVGEQVTAQLLPDGSVAEGAVLDNDVTIQSYEQLLGHNVASPFASWASDLPMPALNLLGLPISEPYWVETQVDGEPRMVLIQAFERRILTYTPSNPEGWQVESANTGTHYRMWRGIERPENPELAKIAAELSFGEEILAAARDHYVDPYMLVSVAKNLTDGNSFAVAESGGVGLFAIQPSEENEDLDLHDPRVNADLGAQRFAAEMYKAWDWGTILSNFYSNSRTMQISTDESSSWADSVLATYNELTQTYPPTGPKVDPVREAGKLVGEGRVAYYDPSYDVAWWANAMSLHAGWGNAVEGWQPDPNGFYCVHPDYKIGERLKVEANGRVLECTIGDAVAGPHQIAWRSRWTLEMSWPTFQALGLDRANHAVVYYLGDRVIPDPTPVPSETPAASPSPSPQPTEPAIPAGQDPAGIPGGPGGSEPPPPPPPEQTVPPPEATAPPPEETAPPPAEPTQTPPPAPTEAAPPTATEEAPASPTEPASPTTPPTSETASPQATASPTGGWE